MKAPHTFSAVAFAGNSKVVAAHDGAWRFGHAHKEGGGLGRNTHDARSGKIKMLF